MAKTVMTVTGPVPVDRLGMTFIHELFTFAYPGWFADECLTPYKRIGRTNHNFSIRFSSQTALKFPSESDL
jgi:hypothetical protein